MHCQDSFVTGAVSGPKTGLWKRVLAGLLSVSLALSAPMVLAQQPGVPGIQELLRGQAGIGGVGSAGSVPRPAAGFDASAIPAPLRNPVATQKVVCRFSGSASASARGAVATSSAGLVAGANAVIASGSGQGDYEPNDFELYVESRTGQQLCRFGHQASYDLSSFFEPPPLGMVPEDYVLGPGDEVFVRLWGSVELDVALVIDRSGQVVVPRVGPVKLGGARYGQAAEVVRQATRRLFSDFNASITLGRLRGIRVYVTGYAERPGAYNISNLSSLSSIVMSTGGPSKAGSYRSIQLRRAGKVISEFDLYDLLLRGNKAMDRPLLSEDVIHFGPIGGQVAVLGGVNKPAVFEIKPGETIAELIAMAGGLSPGADPASVHKLAIDERLQGFKPLAAEQLASTALRSGDIFLAKNDSRFPIPDDRSTRRILIVGQVKNPGEYFLPPSATLRDAIQMAGGFAPGAYPYGIQLTRLSVRVQQEVTLERVLRELDRDIVSSSTIRPLNADEARLLQVRSELSKTLVERLQSLKPDGRLALPISPNSAELPLVDLEHGDQITVPLIPAHVGVYGSVINGGTFLYRPNSRAADYIALAGGPTRGAETDESFLIRANGQAEKLRSGLGGGNFLGRALGGGASDKQIYPGDNVVVPEDMAKTTVYRELASWATLLYQLGLGAAALKVLRN